MSGATKINHGQSDCVINWAGGLHHAKKGEVTSVLPASCFIQTLLVLHFTVVSHVC